MRGGGQPVTFHVGPGAEPPGDPGSWGGSKVGIGWRRGGGGREGTELLSNTWGAEGGAGLEEGYREDHGGAQAPTGRGGLGWHWGPSFALALAMATGHPALLFVSPSETLEAQCLQPWGVVRGAENTGV